MTVSILVTGCGDEAHVREALDSVSVQLASSSFTLRLRLQSSQTRSMPQAAG